MVLAEKKALLSKIEDIDDALILSRLNHIVGELETDIANSSKKLARFESLIEEVTSHTKLVNEPLTINVDFNIDNSQLAKFEKAIAKPMFWLSFTSLVLIGLLIMYGSEEINFFPENRFTNHVFVIALSLWPIFLIEFLLKLKLARNSIKAKYLLFIHSTCLLFPPVRIVIGSIAHPSFIWLPFINWSKVNPALAAYLKKKFLVPVLVLGLLMIPALLVEIKFQTQLTAAFPHLDLNFYLQTFHALVWVGFAIEFIILISVAEDKKAYCTKNWMDILILLLPIVSFFRSFRFLRALKFNQLAHSFRMKGTQAKIKEGLLLLDFLKRLGYLYNPEVQIKRVKKKMMKNQQERVLLESEMLEAITIFLKKRNLD
ncbi:MAG: hypothetical protein AAGI07_07030 [Bacteroidota bacterium]